MHNVSGIIAFLLQHIWCVMRLLRRGTFWASVLICYETFTVLFLYQKVFCCGWRYNICSCSNTLKVSCFESFRGMYFVFQVALMPQTFMWNVWINFSTDHVSLLLLLLCNKLVFVTGLYQLINAYHTQATQMIHLTFLYPAIISLPYND